MKPTPANCYRCGKLSHLSNICSKHRSLNLVEDVIGEAEGEAKDENYGDYNEAEYAQEDRD